MNDLHLSHLLCEKNLKKHFHCNSSVLSMKCILTNEKETEEKTLILQSYLIIPNKRYPVTENL